MKKHSSVAIFEAQAALYEQRYGRLAPGKSEPMETARYSGDDENISQFDNWRAVHAYIDALNRICTLQEAIEQTDLLLDDAQYGPESERPDALKERQPRNCRPTPDNPDRHNGREPRQVWPP